MKISQIELTDDLRIARRALDGLANVQLLNDWRFYEPQHIWALECRLLVRPTPEGLVPEASDWFVLVNPSYPVGLLKVVPSKNGGITHTFPHQRYNSSGDHRVPWRDGMICVDVPAHVFGRTLFTGEPHEAETRLAWHIERALAWLNAAAQGRLLLPGDPFELPDFPIDELSPFRIGFVETEALLNLWESIPNVAGIAELKTLESTIASYAIERFKSTYGQVLIDPEWGNAVTSKSRPRSLAIWIRLPAVPVLQPWQAPATWRELRQACSEFSVDLDSLLIESLHSMKTDEDLPHLLLVGFPIPRKVGSPPERLHWQAINLPKMISSDKQVRGFRPGQSSMLYHNLNQAFRDSAGIRWLKSQNWAPDQITSRGALSMALSSKKVLLIGAGALGSAIAEMMVRAGLLQILLIDNAKLEMGNLTRHTLEIGNLAEYKVEALAKRLARMSPNVHPTVMASEFPPYSPHELARIRSCDLIIDCTADDQVVADLSTISFDRAVIFISLSLSTKATRLFWFGARAVRFPAEQFYRQLNPWLEIETQMISDELPREGIGCWNPVFPARVDDVWMMAAAAIKQIEAFTCSDDSPTGLVIFEQTMSSDGSFCGLRKVPNPSTS